MSDADFDDDTKLLCATCISEAYLCQKVENEGEERTCSYCKTVGQCFTIEAVADLVETAFAQHYTRTNPDPDYGGERDGDLIAVMIADVARIEEQPAEDIQKLLEERYSEMNTYYEEQEFASDAQYEAKGPDDSKWMAEWNRFETQLKTETRFFSREASATLASIFADVHLLATRKGKRAVVTAGPGKRLRYLYRARVFLDAESLTTGISYPEAQIGPPPSKLAKAGRMNAAGISVFYGATDAQVALSEVRPPVGSRVVVCRFEIIRPLLLLDLSTLKYLAVGGSVFDPEFIGRLERAKFLERLSSRMTMPVMPGDEEAEYLTTQAIADYLCSESDPPLDGIIYPSVQAKRTTERNVILFHKASMVVPSDLPPGTKVDAHLSMPTEDGEEPWFTVWENLPPEKRPEEKKDDDFPGFLSAFEAMNTNVEPARLPALKLEKDKIVVHNVAAVRFTTSHDTVTHHRRDAKDWQNPPF